MLQNKTNSAIIQINTRTLTEIQIILRPNDTYCIFHKISQRMSQKMYLYLDHECLIGKIQDKTTLLSYPQIHSPVNLTIQPIYFLNLKYICEMKNVPWSLIILPKASLDHCFGHLHSHQKVIPE